MGTLQVIIGLITFQQFFGHVYSDCSASISYAGYQFVGTPSSFAAGGGVAQLTCASGYVGSGSGAGSSTGANITCPGNSAWQKPDSLTCTLNCLSTIPTTGDWATLILASVTSNAAGTGTATVNCATNYGAASGSAPATITCSSSGSWSLPSSLKCVPICPATVTGYTFTSLTVANRQPGQTVATGITCTTSSHTQVPSSPTTITATCPQATGTSWTFSPSCIANCPSTVPSSAYMFQPVTGDSSVATVTPSSTYQFACASGYSTPTGGLPGIATCPSTASTGVTLGQWSIATPECKAVCQATNGNPYTSGQNAPATSQLVPKGAAYQYACTTDYRTVEGTDPDMPATVQCVATTLPTPTGCIKVCPATAGKDGYVLGSDGTPTAVQRRPSSTTPYQFECDTGYATSAGATTPSTASCPAAGTDWSWTTPCLKQCAAGTSKPAGYTWTGTNTVTNSGAAPQGVTNVVCDSSAYAGTATVTCSEGVFTGSGCAKFCAAGLGGTSPATGYKFSVATDAVTNSGTAPSSPSGITKTCDTTSTTAPYSGTATITCTNGAWTVSGCNRACVAGLGGTDPATGYKLSVATDAVTANGAAPSSPSGITKTCDTTSTTAPYSGTATITCTNGAWTVSGCTRACVAGLGGTSPATGYKLSVATDAVTAHGAAPSSPSGITKTCDTTATIPWAGTATITCDAGAWTVSGCNIGCAATLGAPTGYTFTGTLAVTAHGSAPSGVTLACNTNTHAGTPTVTCNNGAWSASGCVAFCSGTPTTPAAANYVQRSVTPTAAQKTPGSSDAYQFLCADGFGPDDGNANALPGTSTCSAAGAWSTPSPACVANCALPSQAPDNYAWGLNAPTTPATYSGGTTTYQFSCNTGYTASGGKPSTVTCGSGGSWSTPSTACIKNCQTAAFTGYDMVSGGTLPTDAQAAPGQSGYQWACATGYTTSTGTAVPGTASCPATTGSSWSIASPTCNLPCGSTSGQLSFALSSPAAAALHAGSSTSVSTTCNTGYSTALVSGSTTAPSPGSVTCQIVSGSAGVWSTPSPACLPICSTTSVTPNTGYTWTSASPSSSDTVPNAGTTVSVKCATGYSARGGSSTSTGTVTCKADGTGWSVPSGIECTPDCTAIVPSPAYDFVTSPTGTQLTSGTGMADVKCATGYYATATTGTSTCGYNGVFQPPNGINCAYKCTSTAPTGYKFVTTPSDFTPGTATANVICDTGYTQTSTGTVGATGVQITCPSNQDWPMPDSSVLTCQTTTTSTTTTAANVVTTTTSGADVSRSSFALSAAVVFAAAMLRRAL